MTHDFDINPLAIAGIVFSIGFVIWMVGEACSGIVDAMRKQSDAENIFIILCVLAIPAINIILYAI